MSDKPTFKVGDVVEVFDEDSMASMAEIAGLPQVPFLTATIVAPMTDTASWFRFDDERYANDRTEDGRWWTTHENMRLVADLASYTSRMIDFMSTQQRNFFETSIKPFVRAILFRHAPEASRIELTPDSDVEGCWLEMTVYGKDGERLAPYRMTNGTSLVNVLHKLDDEFILPYLNDGETLVLTSIGDKAKEDE